MSTQLYTHAVFLDHDTGPGHPERADRLRAVLQALEDGAFANLDRREAPRAEREQLLSVHAEAYVDAVLANVPTEGRVHLDPDTVMSPGSGEAALRAAGAVCAAVDAVMTGQAENAFCAVRPPGHHAEATRAMGFCLFNNVAVAALHGRARHGIERVAVVDFDVHHGNGTQHMFEADAGLFFASTHQSPFYPGTGSADERGVGNIFNVPLSAFSGSAEFRAAMEGTILPALRAFAPELLLISAGFDAHTNDPLAQLNFVEEDYAWVTRELLAVAKEHCQGRTVSTLEGGYDLAALGASAAAHVAALLAA
jgi:acetoin utilization deacetylase AcuC-like enzyme